MLHFIGKNPATLDVKPLTNYTRTFRQIERKARKRGGKVICVMFGNRIKVPESVSAIDLGFHQVLLYRQGSFTIAAILDSQESPISFGYAKRNPADKENPEKSEHIAVHRAISNLFVEEVKQLDGQPDSLVFSYDVETTSYTKQANKPNAAFDVHRIPFIKELKGVGVRGRNVIPDLLNPTVE